ncbi:MAG: D-alanyl-D-alanine carboxypeptidase [Clostridiales bacterium]|nr:D-alanyl-D-alanine carboxypeptidase [Clostridiales bacterium]MBD9159425.1 D-alanyl-D-alanine carboxypeptidase [Clostridiales bacterium]
MNLKINYKNSICKVLIVLTLTIFVLIGNIGTFGTYVLANNTNSGPDINAESALLIDNKTNKVLYSKDMNRKMFPASTTKILTAILVLENHSLDEKVTASYNAVMTIPSGYSTASIQIDEVLTVEQLLELLLVHSANDAANVLAEYTGGSIDSFVAMMNTKINELGLSDTHFTNPYGLQDNNHYTTAHDLAIIMQYCLKNDDFRKIAGQASCAIPSTNKSEPRKYSSTNELLIAGNSNYYPNLIAGKTGYTSEAGECLVSAAYNDNLELVGVILNSNNRFKDTRSLYNYGYTNFSIKNIVNEKDIITNVEVKNATKDTKNLNLLVSEDIPVLANNSDDLSKIEPQITLNNDIKAPIEDGQVLGKVSYSVNGITYSTDLIAANNVEKSNFVLYCLYGLGILILILIIYKIIKHFIKN